MSFVVLKVHYGVEIVKNMVAPVVYPPGLAWSNPERGRLAPAEYDSNHHRPFFRMCEYWGISVHYRGGDDKLCLDRFSRRKHQRG